MDNTVSTSTSSLAEEMGMQIHLLSAEQLEDSSKLCFEPQRLEASQLTTNESFPHSSITSESSPIEEAPSKNFVKGNSHLDSNAVMGSIAEGLHASVERFKEPKFLNYASTKTPIAKSFVHAQDSKMTSKEPTRSLRSPENFLAAPNVPIMSCSDEQKVKR
jgi:hypothetical protein